MSRVTGYVCDACGKASDHRTFWLSGHVRVKPYTGGVRAKRDGYNAPEIIGRRKTTFDVCSVECLGHFLASGAAQFLPPRKVEGDW